MVFSQRSKKYLPRTFCLKKIQGLFKHRKKVRGLIIFLLLILVLSSLGIFVFGVGEAKAFSLINIGFKVMAEIISRIGAIIHAIVSLFFWLCAMLLELAFGLEGFTNAGVVTIGWAITRDLANMFFALILLIIAFATILRIETYGIKQILWRLVVAALLINFSLVLAGVIIDFSQVLTHFFYDQVKGSLGISAHLANVFGMSKIPKIIPEASAPEALAAGGAGIIMMIFSIFLGIILIVLAGFALIIGAFFLIVRLIALWILLIFAPLAWLCMIMPATRNLWSKWWSEFFKWAFFAPIYAFFVFLAIKAGDAGSFTGIIQQEMENIVNASGWAATLGTTLMSTPRLFIQFLVVVGLLFGGVIVGQKFGVFGAGAMIAAGKAVGMAPLGAVDKWLSKGGEKVGPGWQAKLRRAGSYLSPTAWKKAWEQRQIQKERESIPVTAGKRQDLMNRLITWGIFRGKLGEKTDYAERAKRKRRGEERKEIFTNNAEELVAGFENAKKENLPHKMGAYTQALAEQNDLNELFRHYAKIHPETADKYTFDAEGVTNFVDDTLKPAMGEQDAHRLGHDLMRIEESVGQWLGRPFQVEIDAKTGEAKYIITGPTPEIKEKAWKDRTDEEKEASAKWARQIANVEWTKQEPQMQTRLTGRFSFIHEGYEPKTGKTIDEGLTEDAPRKIATLSARNADRFHTHSMATLMLNHAEEMKEINPGFYDALDTRLKIETEGMTPEQIKAYMERLRSFIGAPSTDPMARHSTWTREGIKPHPKEPPFSTA